MLQNFRPLTKTYVDPGWLGLNIIGELNDIHDVISSFSGSF